MSVNLVKLAAEGRAFSASRPWTDEEHDALIALSQERELDFKTAALWIRNGILSVEHFDQAVKNGMEPKTLEEIEQEAVEALREKNLASFKRSSTKKATKTTTKKAAKKK